MRHASPTTIVRDWQRASNVQDADRLLELSDPDIEIFGPRGSVRGREVLGDWLSRANLSLKTLRTFARGNAVVLAQHGVWKSQQTGGVTGEADLAARFLVDNGRVSQLARYDGDGGLAAALEEAGLGYADEVVSEVP